MVSQLLKLKKKENWLKKNNVKKTVQKKMFPGYVLINMVMNDDTWYVVRNTRGVTGFVGPGSKPVPLTEAEMKPKFWEFSPLRIPTFTLM